MADSLRDLIAETLAAHVSELWSGSAPGWRCSCGEWSMPYDFGPLRAATLHRQHVTDALMAALDGHLIPPGSETTVVRSIQGEDSDGPWIEYVYEGDDWPARGERFTRLEIGTPWVAVETAGQTPRGTDDE